MKSRKLLSLCLAFVLILAVAAPAYAADIAEASYGRLLSATDGSVTQGEISFSAIPQAPIINVAMPPQAAQKVILNPYAMKVDLTAIGGTRDDVSQVVSPTYFLKNYSNTNVSVGVTLNTSSSNVTLSQQPINNTRTGGDKTAFIYLDTKVVNRASSQQVTWTPFTTKTEAQLVSTGTDQSLRTPYVLAAAQTASATEAGVGGQLAQQSGALAFKVGGSLNGSPDADKVWGASDSIAIKLTFTVTPTSAAATAAAT